MRRSSSPLIIAILIAILFTYFSSCSNQKHSETAMSIEQELDKIDSLLRDAAFTRAMAETLDAAYYKGIGEVPPPFLSPEEERGFIVKPAKDEKIATNLAGFYALECGISMLSAKSGEKPVTLI